MRYPPEQKAKTRGKILDAASRVFRRQGYQGGGVDAVMREAGLTHGGFYSHFRNKEALFGETVLHGLESMRPQHGRWTEGLQGHDWLRAFLAGYLDRRHAEHLEAGCPAAALVSELGRVGPEPKRAFERGLQGWAESIARHLDRDPEAEPRPATDPDAAFGVIAACIGGLALARAVDDEQLTDRILASTRDLVERAIAGDSDTTVEEARS